MGGMPGAPMGGMKGPGPAMGPTSGPNYGGGKGPGFGGGPPPPPMQNNMGGGGGGGFKTKICTYFEQGKCTRGDACTFAHGQHELAKGASKGGPGFGAAGGKGGGFMQQPQMGGNSFGKGGPPQPALGGGYGGDGTAPYKTKMCTFFEQGKCTRGDACTFAHDPSELSGGKGKGGGKPGGKPGNFGPKGDGGGFGKGGPKGGKGGAPKGMNGAPSGGGGFKTKMCTFFEKGKCTRGDQCTFAHSPAELQQG